MNTVDLQEQIAAQLAEIFYRYAKGWDVPPALTYHCEGLMQIAVANGIVDKSNLVALKQQLCDKAFNGEDQPTVNAGDSLIIPALMQSAPVTPSTTSN